MFVHQIAMSKIRGNAKYRLRFGETEITLMSNERGRLVVVADTAEDVTILGPLEVGGPVTHG